MAAVYLRNQHRDGHFPSTLLMSKTKLAPTTTHSVIKMELQAALPPIGHLHWGFHHAASRRNILLDRQLVREKLVAVQLLSQDLCQPQNREILAATAPRSGSVFRAASTVVISPHDRAGSRKTYRPFGFQDPNFCFSRRRNGRRFFLCSSQ